LFCLLSVLEQKVDFPFPLHNRKSVFRVFPTKPKKNEKSTIGFEEKKNKKQKLTDGYFWRRLSKQKFQLRAGLAYPTALGVSAPAVLCIVSVVATQLASPSVTRPARLEPL